MSVLKYFKNTPGRPPKGRQALSVIFFSLNLQRGPGKKKGGLSPTPGATRSLPPIYKPWPPFPCHLILKIQEKREG